MRNTQLLCQYLLLYLPGSSTLRQEGPRGAFGTHHFGIRRLLGRSQRVSDGTIRNSDGGFP